MNGNIREEMERDCRSSDRVLRACWPWPAIAGPWFGLVRPMPHGWPWSLGQHAFIGQLTSEDHFANLIFWDDWLATTRKTESARVFAGQRTGHCLFKSAQQLRTIQMISESGLSPQPDSLSQAWKTWSPTPLSRRAIVAHSNLSGTPTPDV